MKLTILMDNNTYIDQYYLGEPAFGVYLNCFEVYVFLLLLHGGNIYGYGNGSRQG